MADRTDSDRVEASERGPAAFLDSAGELLILSPLFFFAGWLTRFVAAAPA